ncbi:derlin-1 [Plasmodium reichenowi]|uniref:Derlin n=1 Tax=Plasmodium reichenowi TaxID=5854 RepID=A0A060S0K3_PLARE|nr:derlin-1, putative [Plasmodium reichenowi]KYN94335.1 derlin-1, putative [Plasmodium reichenowi]CDO67149.1 derlin-1 [Plasmodium reichenowi]SOV83478.1 derlin-1 [Plasmodium reichenowi]
MVQLSDVLGNVPLITRLYLILSFALMVLCSLDIISPLSLYLNWNLVLREHQYWRLITCFLYFGSFGIHFFWDVYVLIYYCSSLEEVTFRNNSADFLWMIILSCCMLLGVSYMFGGVYFYSSCIINVITYIWSKNNSTTRLTILFFTIRASYLPWALTLLSLIVDYNSNDNFFGILVGHIYFFFTSIFPHMPIAKNTNIFKTPRVLKWLLKEDSS